jgi:hypothetical protein
LGEGCAGETVKPAIADFAKNSGAKSRFSRIEGWARSDLHQEHGINEPEGTMVRRCLFAAVVFLAPFTARSAQAGLVTLSSFTVHVNDMPVDLVGVDGTGRYTRNLDIMIGTAKLRAVGYASTGSGSASATLIVDTFDNPPGSANYHALVFAAMGAAARVYERRMLPLTFQPPAFVKVRLRGYCEVDGGDGDNISGAASINSSVSVQNGSSYQSQNHASTNAGDQRVGQYDDTDPIEVFPTVSNDAIISCGFGAEATVNSQAVGGSIEISANADPEISFDQPAFDAYALAHGFPTFNLADYYGIELSEGLMVPEPSALALLIVAIPVCLLVAWRLCVPGKTVRRCARSEH